VQDWTVDLRLDAVVRIDRWTLGQCNVMLFGNGLEAFLDPSEALIEGDEAFIQEANF